MATAFTTAAHDSNRHSRHETFPVDYLIIIYRPGYYKQIRARTGLVEAAMGFVAALKKKIGLNEPGRLLTRGYGPMRAI